MVDEDDEEQPLIDLPNSAANSNGSTRLHADMIHNTMINNASSLADLTNSPNSEELHFDEPWFHGQITPKNGGGHNGSAAEGQSPLLNKGRGREEAERRIRACTTKVDGSFLVRDSDTYIGDYSLSFWARNQVHHARIRQKRMPNGKLKYYLIDSVMFDTLYYLVTFYQANPVKAGNISVCLTEPVPPTACYKGKEWYCDNISREQADELLSRVRFDGAFLVRRSDANDMYLISFRARSKIMHCRLRKEGRLYFVYSDGKKFENLCDLIAYYRKHPLYR